MSSKFRAWLRVTPSPTTFAESSAIYRSLKSHGQIQAFARVRAIALALDKPKDELPASYFATFAGIQPTEPVLKKSKTETSVTYFPAFASAETIEPASNESKDDHPKLRFNTFASTQSPESASNDFDDYEPVKNLEDMKPANDPEDKTAMKESEDHESALYCATFAREPLHLEKSFKVTTYHDVVDPKEADPYNIRGLQNRKPYPAPKTFACILEKVEEENAVDRSKLPESPWRGKFSVKQDHWFQPVLEETGAPLGTARGLCVTDGKYTGDGIEKKSPIGKPPRKQKMQMNALMDPWRVAVEEYENKRAKGLLQSK